MPNYNFTDLNGVVTAAILQIVISWTAFCIFAYFRPRNKTIYSKKDPNSTIGKGFFDWYLAIWELNEKQLIEKMGMDGYLFILFIELGCKFFGILALFSIPLGILHFLAPRIDSGTESKVTDNPDAVILSLTTLTMSNLSSSSNLYYIHTILAYVYSIIAGQLLYSLWMKFCVLRQWYMRQPEFQMLIESKTLMFTEVGTDLLQSTKMYDYLRKECKLAFKPNSIVIGKDYKLDKLVAEHLAVSIKLEKVLVKYLNTNPTPKERPVHREPMLIGKKVDSIETYAKKLHELEREIYELKSKELFPVNHSAFVTFASVRETHAACKQIDVPLLKSMPFRPSPRFSDLIWDNIGVDKIVKKSRKLIAFAVTCALILGWVFLNISIAAVAGSLITQAPLPPSLIVFLQSIVTPLVNAVLIILLPIFLRYIARLQCVSSVSGVERAALYKFFAFQIYQYITQLAASLLFSILSDFSQIGNINYILTTLATAFNAQSTYFITFLVTGYTGYGVALIQIAPLLIGPFKKKYLSSTPRDEEEINATQKMDYLAAYGFLLMTMMLGLSYSVVAPLIIPFSALLFFLALVSFRYLLLFVVETEFETGGRWFYKIFNMVIANLIIFQISTFISILSLSARSGTTTSKVSSAFALALPFLTLLFWSYCEYVVKPKTIYISSSSNLYLESSPEDDEATAVSDSGLSDAANINPIVSADLARVWLPENMSEKGNELYTPEFQNFKDFVQKTVHDPKMRARQGLAD